jgi:hypothetical protein
MGGQVAAHFLLEGLAGQRGGPTGDALAQCRIGFQPVSPSHGTNPQESISRHKHCKIYRSKGTIWAWKRSSRGPGDRLEAYPTLRRRGSGRVHRNGFRVISGYRPTHRGRLGLSSINGQSQSEGDKNRAGNPVEQAGQPRTPQPARHVSCRHNQEREPEQSLSDVNGGEHCQEGRDCHSGRHELRPMFLGRYRRVPSRRGERTCDAAWAAAE